MIAQMEKAGYVDLYRQVATRLADAAMCAPLDLRIDFIFASQPLAPQVTACGIITTADHVPGSPARVGGHDFVGPARTVCTQTRGKQRKKHEPAFRASSVVSAVSRTDVLQALLPDVRSAVTLAAFADCCDDVIQ